MGLLLIIVPASSQTVEIYQCGDTTSLSIKNPKKYMLLPIEESQNEVQILERDTWMDIRLAQDKVDYYVPFELNSPTVKILGLRANSLILQPDQIKFTDSKDVINTDYFRPIYHHTPSYGWMNDPNGLILKDGMYNLYYQYNPYGSKWGNMHWGHAVSRDLMHWQELPPAIARDTLGHIFSGSSIVDKYNSAGYGKESIIAFYTSASDKNGQLQCLAYSKDNGSTFTKYEGNPILRPFDGLKDFRDPKVFWYEPSMSWYMIVSADKEMRFYRSTNLKDWSYVSSFGKGYGAQPNQFECPDFFPLTINGKKKYVMIVNINPGCLFGGSATEYFIGDFDGKDFKCDTKPEFVKWLDYGKDHYAAVTFSNTGNRIIAMPWMSNWQYANVTPIKQYRGANALPRELSLFEKDGHLYVAANAIQEIKALRKEKKTVNRLILNEDYIDDSLFYNNDGAFEIEADITPGSAEKVGLDIYNVSGEKSMIYFDMADRRLVMDRTRSGLIDFGRYSSVHNIELQVQKDEQGLLKPARMMNAINYENDFALGTWAPLNLCEGKTYHIDIFVDKCSIEIFVDGGRIAITNLVFPTKPYNGIRLYSKGGKAKITNMTIYKIGI